MTWYYIHSADSPFIPLIVQSCHASCANKLFDILFYHWYITFECEMSLFVICRCVVVEDSAIGLAAAKAAGMKCIITKSGYTPILPSTIKEAALCFQNCYLFGTIWMQWNFLSYPTYNKGKPAKAPAMCGSVWPLRLLYAVLLCFLSKRLFPTGISYLQYLIIFDYNVNTTHD